MKILKFKLNSECLYLESCFWTRHKGLTKKVGWHVRQPYSWYEKANCNNWHLKTQSRGEWYWQVDAANDATKSTILCAQCCKMGQMVMIIYAAQGKGGKLCFNWNNGTCQSCTVVSKNSTRCVINQVLARASFLMYVQCKWDNRL